MPWYRVVGVVSDFHRIVDAYKTTSPEEAKKSFLANQILAPRPRKEEDFETILVQKTKREKS